MLSKNDDDWGMVQAKSTQNQVREEKRQEQLRIQTKESNVEIKMERITPKYNLFAN